MGLTPISRIHDLINVGSSRGDGEVAGPVAPDRSSRMEDDAYKENGDSADRGMEEEDADDATRAGAEQAEEAVGSSSAGDSRVNLFA